MQRSCSFLIALLLLPLSLYAQKAYIVEGIILDRETNKPVPGVSIRIVGTQRGTYSSPKGTFRLPMPAGSHTVAFSAIGYEKYETTFSPEITKPTVRLAPSAVQMGDVQVTGELTADNIIKRAVQRKEENLAKLQTFQGLLYSKFTLEIEGNFFGEIKDKDRHIIMETFSDVYRDYENDRTAIAIVQRRQTANIPAEENLVAIGNFVNFYDDEVQVLNTAIPSPLAADAFSYYSYTLQKRIPYGNRFIYVVDVHPTTTLFPAFEGTLHIVEGSYNLIEAKLAPSASTSIAYVRNLTFHQRFEPFENDIWYPAFLHITGKMHINAIAGMAEVTVPIQINSIYNDTKINQPIPDSVFRSETVTVAPYADSSRPEFWENNSLSTLTEQEQEIYRQVDSLVAATPPEKKEAGTFSFEWLPLLSFNRVGGPTGGVLSTVSVAPVSLETSVAYSFGLERALGSAELQLDVIKTTGASLSLSGGVFSQLSSHPSYPDFLNSVYTALFHTDYNDYFREDGWNAGLSGSIGDLSTSWEARFSRHFCEQNTIAYSAFTEEEFRPNPVFQAGNYQTLRGTLEWGNYGTVISISNGSSIGVDAQISALYGEEKSLGAPFRTIEAGVALSIPTFYTGYLPMELSLDVAAGAANGALPPQYNFVLQRRFPVFGRLGHFATAPIGLYGGTEYVRAYAEHNCSDMFWRMLGLPLYEGRGLELILEGGAARYRNSSANTVYASTDNQWYGEVGFGIGKIPTFFSNIFFLRLDALFGVGPLGAGRFGMTATISSPF